jgi:hypothetical protein
MNLDLLLPIALLLTLLVAGALLARPRPSGHLAYRVGPEYGSRGNAAGGRRGRRHA